ncbi:MAG TPA: CehA/McbA family metallohydrolase [Pirellulales bacterium]|nr:CehA/McbA family metallohydrolase [Pirellulales bacterium]
MNGKFNVVAGGLLWMLSVAAAGIAETSPPIAVEAQPLAANLQRLQQALDYLGTPLSEQTSTNLQEAARSEDAELLQAAIDPQVAFVVEINPESRVRVARGQAPARLQQGGFTPFVVKVVNYGEVTQPLRIHSPAGGAVYSGENRGILERQQRLDLQSDQEQAVPGRFLNLEMFGAPPMTARLSGLAVEYCIALIYSAEAGRREATIRFDVDQGTQDLGFRGETPVLFNISPAIPVNLRVLDEDGRPTTARFLFRDRAGHVYPSQPKRLYPDFFFQPHIYRADGETVLLPPGEFSVEISRGPEYHTLRRSLTLPTPANRSQVPAAEFSVRLERWINPQQFGFYSGDHHIHAAGCSHYSSPSEGILPPDALRQVKGEGLNVGCILTWGFCYDFQRQFYSPVANKVSEPLTVIKYDIEVSGFGSQALGHVCLLNLRDHVYPGTEGMQGWPTWATPALRWAKEQGGFTGYPHSGSSMQVEPAPASARMMAEFDANHDHALSAEEAEKALLPELFSRIDADADGVLTQPELARSHERIAEQLPNLGIPEAPLEIIAATAHGVCDFISTMDTPRVREWNAWYHLMNCGFPIKVAGETDFPCMSGTRVGQGRTYVQLGDVEKVDFQQWCEGLAGGRSYASDGYAHALRFAVEGAGAGHEIKLDGPKKVVVTASVAFASQTPLEVAYGLAMPAAGKVWLGDTVTIHAAKQLASVRERTVELVVNGRVVASAKVPADDQVHDVRFEAPVERSSWIALRQFPQLHTNPVTVLVADKPIRASRSSARWCAALIAQLWRAREHNVALAEREAAHASFRRAIEIYRQIAAESPEGT